jgi:hypothetical protein
VALLLISLIYSLDPIFGVEEICEQASFDDEFYEVFDELGGKAFDFEFALFTPLGGYDVILLLLPYV